MDLKTLNKYILKTSQKDLLEFIRSEFLASDENSVVKLRNNYQILSQLPNDILIIGIARMKKIEEDNDISKYIPVITAFLLIILLDYSEFFGGLLSFLFDKILIKIFLYVGFFCYLGYIFSVAKLNKSKALYFRDLLESVKKQNDNR
jgi:hypothetical protein